MVLLTGISGDLRAENPVKAEELSKKVDGWIKQLQKKEGTEGTNWRYLAAERLLSEFGTGSNDKQLLEEAGTHCQKIDSLRPHWGLASSLAATIASLKAKVYKQKAYSEEAVSLWRRAIRDGDGRISTVLDLVRELERLDRRDQAEVVFQRISGWSDSVVPVSEVAVSSAMGRGDFREAMAIAERLTNNNPNDFEGWVLRARTAFEASLAPGLDAETQTIRRDEAWAFLEKAQALGGGVSTWDLRFRFKFGLGDKAGAITVLEQLLEVPTLPEDVRFLMAGRGYTDLKEFGRARDCLERCLLLNQSAEVHLAFANLYYAIGDNEQFLASLRKAHNADPKNEVIRERLALNLAFLKAETSDGDLKEIDALLAGASQNNATRSSIIGALIALQKGDKYRQDKAVKTLQQIADSTSSESIEAKRMLASYFALQSYNSFKEGQPKEAFEKFESAKLLYDELLNQASINPEDAARYVNLLLLVDSSGKEAKLEPKEDYLAIAERTLSQLEEAAGSSIALLQLKIRLAMARGDNDAVASIAEKFVESAGSLESLGMQNLWEITGQTLVQLGHSEKSISWFEKVYEQDPKKYGLLVVALASQKEFDRAIEICVKAYQAESTPVAATLIAEVAMMRPDVALRENASVILKEALAKYTDSAELLEAMGTLQLMQRRIPEAVGFYEMAVKIDPKRRRTLNNLAMALSELPMREKDAIRWIEKAIEIHGRDPDLLDTLGQVYFRNGRLQEALTPLAEACSRRDDVSFRIHLAQVHMARADLISAEAQWTKIKESKFEEAALPPDDRSVLKELNAKFGEQL